MIRKGECMRGKGKGRESCERMLERKRERKEEGESVYVRMYVCACARTYTRVCARVHKRE